RECSPRRRPTAHLPTRRPSDLEAIGAKKNSQFSDSTASCMVLSETIHVMLLTHDKFSQFTPRRIANAKETTEVLICISSESKDRSEEHTSELQSRENLVCRLLL